MKKIRVMLAEDERIVELALRLLINAEADMEVVAVAVNGVDAVAQARMVCPDVVLLDLLMPQKGGQEALEEMLQGDPSLRVLIMTGYSDVEQVATALQSGAKGYLLKHCPPPELVQAIRYVHQGEIFLHPLATRRLLQQLDRERAAPPAHTLLTPRELDVLRAVAQGLSNKEIGEALDLHPSTVKGYIKQIMAKLDVDNRTRATLYALQNELVALN